MTTYKHQGAGYFIVAGPFKGEASMKYYARCTDTRGKEVLLTVKENTPEDAVKKLKEMYQLEAISCLSTTSLAEPKPKNYWPTTASCMKSSQKHAGRVKGRKAGEA